MSPPGQRQGRPAKDAPETSAAAKPLGLVAQSRMASRARRATRVAQLERAFLDARRRDDREAAQLLAAWLDDEYVSRAHQRAADPQVRRLRRALRVAA